MPNHVSESNPRVPYRMSTDREPLPLYKGKSLMVHVVFNVEYWPFDQPMPRSVMPAPHGKTPLPDIVAFAWVQYGMVAGMPRLIKMMADRGLTASAFMNAACADVYAPCAERMLKAGWEFVGHGYVQRSLQTEDDEEEVIEKSLDRLERLTGKKTRGWLGPGIGESFDTPDILRKHGIEWLADWNVDDLPCWMRTTYGPMIAMPYTVELNDVPIYAIQNHSSDEIYRRLGAMLAVFEDEMRTHPKVMTIALHPHLIGVPHRAHYLAKMLDDLMARDDTVFVTGSEIADWFVEADGTGGAAVA